MSLMGTLLRAMTQYDPNPDRTEHLLKVYGYAKAIGELEGLDASTQEILEVAALLHDIGIKPSLETYGDAAGPHQEACGMPAARGLLEEVGAPEYIIARVCELVGHHHTYAPVLGIDHQILLEADFLVNMRGGHVEPKGIDAMRANVFRTQAGLALLDVLREG